MVGRLSWRQLLESAVESFNGFELGNSDCRYSAKIMTPVRRQEFEWIGQLDIEGVLQHQNGEGVEDKKPRRICDEHDQFAYADWAVSGHGSSFRHDKTPAGWG